MHTAWLSCLAFVALTLVVQMTEAHMAMYYPPPRGGYGTDQFNWKIHTFIGYQGFQFPCGGYKYTRKTKITAMEAGQVIPVRFWTSEMTDDNALKSLPKKNYNEARHGGGLCEFSLSYDDGKTFHVIATYTKTCPDVMYNWPVRIPDNVPSCKTPGKCLFSWSWTSNLVPQFYHNCADVTIDGVEGGKLPSKLIQEYDFNGHKKGVTFDGDGHSHSKGPGPIKSERDAAYRKWT